MTLYYARLNNVATHPTIVHAEQMVTNQIARLLGWCLSCATNPGSIYKAVPRMMSSAVAMRLGIVK